MDHVVGLSDRTGGGGVVIKVGIGLLSIGPWLSNMSKIVQNLKSIHFSKGKGNLKIKLD